MPEERPVRLADYVVSYSLEINNRCLRYLAECDARGSMLTSDSHTEAFSVDTHTVYAESLLARDSRRLMSMWALMSQAWSQAGEGADGAVDERVDEAAIEQHIAALRKAASALTDASSNRRLALRLAALAGEEDEAAAILRVARKLPSDVPLTWDELNTLFAADSHFWRTHGALRKLDDDGLLAQITRSYRKGYRLAGRLGDVDDRKPEQIAVWLDHYGNKFHKWVQLTTHQMELLRAGLSEKPKAQLWYLDKMSDTLRTRDGLMALRRATYNVDVKKSAAQVVVGFIEQQITKMDKRILRLAEGCYVAKPARVAASLSQALDALGLHEVTLMAPQQAGRPLAAGSGPSVDDSQRA